jgi:hypothetical protein
VSQGKTTMTTINTSAPTSLSVHALLTYFVSQKSRKPALFRLIAIISENFTANIKFSRYYSINDEAFYYYSMNDAIIQHLDVDQFLVLYSQNIATINASKRPTKHVAFFEDNDAPWNQPPVVPCPYIEFLDKPYYDEISYLLNLENCLDDQYLPDLTKEGVEPNPGPSHPFIEPPTEDVVFPNNPNPQPIPQAQQAPQPNIFWIIFFQMTLIQKFHFIVALPVCGTYCAIYMILHKIFPNKFPLIAAPNPSHITYLVSASVIVISYFLTKLLIRLLLLMAGVESNPGPVEKDLPRESSETLLADPSIEPPTTHKQTRSHEKRNNKLSTACLNALLETQRREKRLTHLRKAQRESKNTRWDIETPTAPVVTHNNRRLEQFIANKKINPNNLIRKIFTRCCAPRTDNIYIFLTQRCKLDDLVAMALVPILKALQKLFLNKLTIALALTILTYYLAKYITTIPIVVVVPILALILGYLVPNLPNTVLTTITNLYEKFRLAFANIQETLVHSSDCKITNETFPKIDLAILSQAIKLESLGKNWRSSLALYCQTHEYDFVEFVGSVPKHIYDFLNIISQTDFSIIKLQKLAEDNIKANGFSEICSDITEQIQKLFSGVGLIAETFTLPKSLIFYASARKFITQIYGIFTDLYPHIYTWVTGKNYIAPEVAKYLAIFGEISTKVHETLKTSRKTNLLNEDAKFRLQIVLQYEQLLDSQMKLLELKAPLQYMTPVNNLIREMSLLANQCYGRSKGESARDEPVLCLIRGSPGVGKTTVDHALALVIAARLGLKIDLSSDFFIRECGTEFWDGYASQLFVRLDDALQLTDPVMQANTILEIIRMKNRCSYKLNMAALDAKMHSYFTSKFVFISTNVRNVVCDQIADIGAFFRRIDYDVVINSRPDRSPDGKPSFEYDMTVNGKPSSIPILADSMVALHYKYANSDSDISKAIATYASSLPPTAVQDLVQARDSELDFYGKMQNDNYQRPKKKVQPNGFIQRLFVNHYSDRMLLSVLETSNACSRAIEENSQYLKWLAIFAVSSSALFLIAKLVKNFSQQLYPNSRKIKDQEIGDKKTTIGDGKSQVMQQLKAAQSHVDKIATKKIKVKANSSSQRWSSAMISYITEQGWQNQQWVADSLAAVQLIEDFDASETEKTDLQKLQTNIVDITTYYVYRGETFEMFGKAIILNQNHLIAPSHQLPATCPIVNLELNFSGKIINITNCKIERIENSDTCIIEVPTFLPFRDISHMFSPLSEISSLEENIYLLRNFDNEMTICPVEQFRPTNRIIKYNTDYNEIISCGTIFECKVAVCKGDSGCFYVLREHNRFKIVGMHIASDYNCAYGRFVSREMLLKHLQPPRISATPYDSIKQIAKECSRSFDLEIASNSNCIAIGTVTPRTLISNRSKINRSLLYKHKLLPEITEFPVHLKRTFNELDPLLKANNKFRLRKDPIIPTTLKNEILHALLDEHPNTTINVFYSNLQALEGTSEMPHLTMSTSSGFPYSALGRTPKTKLTPQDWKQIFKETDDLLEDLYNGLPPQVIYQTSFKDEIRPLEKIENPRVVNVAATKLTLLFRRVLGPWMNMVHANHNRIRTKVGINVHGDDWKIFYTDLCGISHTNIIELDYTGYEYNHFASGFITAAEFIYLLYKRSGFSERDARAAKLLLESCCGGYVLQNETLIYVWMLLSGLPITAELNSLLNEIYQLICYSMLTSKPLITMNEFVRSGYYGDDLVHAVHDSVSKQFNALTVQKFCEEFLSMKVTPAANKNGQLTPFISILECSFLCRKFAPRENRVDAPLKLEASTNSLQYYTPVSHMTQRELLSSKCRSFITELTHYPKEIYDFWIDCLSSIKHENKLDFICYDYPAALNKRLSNPDL